MQQKTKVQRIKMKTLEAQKCWKFNTIIS